MLPWRRSSDHYPARFGARRIRETQDPKTTTLPQWIANHNRFARGVKHHFNYLDADGTNNGKVERPWSGLDQLKRASKFAAEDIILIPLAWLMEHTPNANDFARIGCKLESPKVIGEEWICGRYASAKIKFWESKRLPTMHSRTKRTCLPGQP